MGEIVVWRALSKKTLAELNYAFKIQNVGTILIERVISIKDSGDYDADFNRDIILIKLKMPNHRVDVENLELCLTEIGIGLIERSNEVNG